MCCRIMLRYLELSFKQKGIIFIHIYIYSKKGNSEKINYKNYLNRETRRGRAMDRTAVDKSRYWQREQQQQSCRGSKYPARLEGGSRGMLPRRGATLAYPSPGDNRRDSLSNLPDREQLKEGTNEETSLIRKIRIIRLRLHGRQVRRCGLFVPGNVPFKGAKIQSGPEPAEMRQAS